MRVAAAIVALVAVAACSRPRPLEVILADSRGELRRGDLKRALSISEEAERQWGSSASSETGWKVRLAKAEALIAGGDSARALECLAPPPPDGAVQIVAARLMHQGWANLWLGRHSESRDLLAQALALAPAQDAEIMAEIQLRRGAVLSRMAAGREAEEALRLALRLARQTGDIYLQAAALGNLGFTRLQALREDEAIFLFEEALALSRQAGAHRLTGGLEGNLGRCYLGLGDFDRSVELLARAERTSAAVGDLNYRQVWLAVLGEVHYGLKRDLPTALAYYRRALSVSRQIGDAYQVGVLLRNMAELAIDSGDLERAEQYAREASELSARHRLVDVAAWNSVASARIAKARGDAAAAEAAYRAALRDASRHDYQALGWFARAGLAELLSASRPAEARAEFETALKEVERARSRLAREGWKLTFQERVTQFYRSYIDFLMSRGEKHRALEIAEASRARLLAQKLRLDTEALDIVPSTRFRDLARTSRAVLVSYWLAPRKSYVWVVTARGIEAAELPGDAELDPLIDAYANVIQGGRDPLATMNEAGERLGSLLLAPLTKLAPGSSRFIVIADGPLHRLNLEALPIAPGRYWIEDATVVVAPSLALLSRNAAAPPSHDSLLVIGNPQQPAPEFPPLPAAAEELAALRKRFQPEVHEGAAAHPGAYAGAGPARFSLIHLSAHATANRQSPLESAVILSKRDGRFKLYAREVIDIPISARLVTISACRSAGARVYTGEGLVGFTWAFLRAGAQNVVAGLWDVNDASTARLMDQLYAEIAAGRAPSEALRAAKLALLHSDTAWRKPFYWAPFQLFSRVPTFFEKR